MESFASPGHDERFFFRLDQIGQSWSSSLTSVFGNQVVTVTGGGVYTVTRDAGGNVTGGTFDAGRSGFTVNPIPEPANLALSLSGLLCLAALARVFRNKS